MTKHNRDSHDQQDDRSSFDRNRAKAEDAARRTVDAIEGSPLGILVGGLAVGALAGALIPRSAKEQELLAPLGRQLGERARAAVTAAREAGKTELAGVGISRDAARDQARSLFDGVIKAATTAGTAARDAAAKPAG